METAARMGWKKLDSHLALLATQAVAGAIGCSWGTDLGYYENLQPGQDPAKVRDVPVWRGSDAYLGEGAGRARVRRGRPRRHRRP